MKLAKVLLFAAVCTTATPALAGTTQSYPVVFTSNGFEGSFGSARNSTDSHQNISCEVNSYATGSRWAYCYAHDSGQFTAYRGCYVYEAAGIDNVLGLSDSDYLRVTYDSATARCTFVGIVKSSRTEPKR